MTPDFIRTALDDIAARDSDLAEGLAAVGYPAPRNRAPGFGTLMGIIAGQQVSTHAATAIRGRLEAAVQPMTPDAFLALDDETLRSVGLSRRKIEYGRGLAEHMGDGHLSADHLHELEDDAVIEAITAVRGLGRWSADIYMLFALGRPDSWPAEDLAIQEALKRLKGLQERPDRAASEALVEHWRPHRGVGALFLWHYYAGAP
ncbi:MAG: DNA-3-methyladenine glycosylase family protein [Alphaproteobacteria bacterium]